MNIIFFISHLKKLEFHPDGMVLNILKTKNYNLCTYMMNDRTPIAQTSVSGPTP